MCVENCTMQKVILFFDILGLSELKWTGMGNFNSDTAMKLKDACSLEEKL